MSRFFFFVLMVIFFGSAVRAESPAEAVNRALSQIEAANALVATAGKKQEKLAVLSAAVAAYETGLGALRSALRANALEITALRARLIAEEDEVGLVLVALQSLGRFQPAPAISHPSGPLATVYSGLSLAAVLPDLQARAAGFRARIEQLSVLDQLQNRAVAGLRDGMFAASNARKLILSKKTGETGERSTALQSATGALRDGRQILAEIAKALATSHPAGSTDAVPSADRFPAPVPGRMLRAFNAPDGAGIQRPGVVLAARAGSAVTTPTAATVRFSGSFPDYGEVVILEFQPGKLLVLAGLAAVLVDEGQNLAAGEIVALLAGNSTTDKEKLIAIPKGTGGKSEETLYIEVREHGEPVDPAIWLDLPGQ